MDSSTRPRLKSPQDELTLILVICVVVIGLTLVTLLTAV